MKRFYRVATHGFSVSLPQGHPLWQFLGNYAPFETEENDARGFCLRLEEKTVRLQCKGTTPLAPLQIALAPEREAPSVALVAFSDDFAEAALYLTEDARRKLPLGKFALDTAAMLQFTLYGCSRSTLLMHASVVKYQGRGYAFLGKSGTGKSTHSRLWLENIPGATLLNDDNPVLRLTGEDAIVYGSPWSGKTECYKNDSARLDAFVDLSQAPENRIRHMEDIEAFLALSTSVSACHVPASRTDTALLRATEAVHASVLLAAESVPVYHLDCRPDAAAAILCKNTICHASN